MRCPSCGKPIETGAEVCRRCGAKIPPVKDYYASFDYSHEIVYSQKGKDRELEKRRKRIIVVVAAAIALCVIIVIALLLMRGNDGKQPEPDGTPVTASQQQTTKAVPETTAVQTTAEAEDKAEDALAQYLKSSGISETLASYADDNMGVSVYTEEQAIIAVYTVSADSTDVYDLEYISSLDGYFDEVCAELDKPIYEMKESTGIADAELEIRCVDLNGAVIFDRSIS